MSINWWEKTQKDIDKLASSKVATRTDAQLQAQDNWINDEDIQSRRRAGHALAHDKISESLKNSRKFKEAIKNRDQSFRDDPKFKEAHKKRMQLLHHDPVWQENHRKGLEALRSDPERWAEYQENYAKGNTAKYEDPKYWTNYYAAIKKRDANPEYHKKRLGASKQKIRKPVQTPLGVFETQTDAANAHGFNNTEKLRHRIKSPNPKFAEYKSLTVEEYEKLKQ